MGDLDGCSDRLRERECVLDPSCLQNSSHPSSTQCWKVLRQVLARPHQHPEVLTRKQKPPRSLGKRKVPEQHPSPPCCVLTTVPMGGVRTQADITGNEQLWERGADLPDGLDGRCVFCICSRASLILQEEKCLST